MSTTEFSATESLLGYLYQVRVALYLTLSKSSSGSDFVVALETLDDVTFEYSSKENPVELLQTKHHQSRQAALTDASVDLWKSLRVWLEQRRVGSLPTDATLHLMSTSSATAGCASSYLRAGEGRNVTTAVERLRTAVSTSTNKSNEDAYALFSTLSLEEQHELLSNVYIHDGSPTITDLEEKLEKEVYWSAEQKNRPQFLKSLEGWWLRRCIKHLASTERAPILSVEVEAEMEELREQYRRDALPIDPDLLEFDVDGAIRDEYANHIFVHQIALIKAGGVRVGIAIRDYYRAFTQRSRWIRTQLTMVGELDRYERRLVEEWQIIFESMRDELGSAVTTQIKEQAARNVLAWAERAQLPIRPNVTEPFVTRGSLHMLANEMRIGWHPEFQGLLAAALQSKRTAP